MGSQRNCTWILGLAGFRVVTTESDWRDGGHAATPTARWSSTATASPSFRARRVGLCAAVTTRCRTSAAQEPPARPTPSPQPAHGARSRRLGREPATPPIKATHTATGGARDRNRARSPVRVADGGLNGVRRRPSGMNYSQTMPSLSVSRMWGLAG